MNNSYGSQSMPLPALAPYETGTDSISSGSKACSPHVAVLPSTYPTFHTPVDGIFVQDQVSALRAAGVRVGVVYPDLRSLRTLRAGRVSESWFQTDVRREQSNGTVYVQGWNIPFSKLGPRLWALSAIRAFTTYIKHFGRPDLCHAHSSIWAGVAAKEVKKRFGIPYVLTEHSSAYAQNLVRKEEETLTREVFADASAVIAVSGFLRSGLQRYANDREIRVIPNLVDTDFFTLPAAPRKPRPFRFLTVALLKPVKGVDLLIGAFHKAFSQRPEIELEIAGEGSERRRLEELARSLNVSGRIIFSGLRTREQVRESMWRSNAFVTSSHTETFGIVLAEALATGLPVISTRCGGPEEIVSPGLGILVPAGSVDSLAQALERVWVDRGGFNEHHLRESVLRKYAAPLVADALLDMYRSVVSCQA